MSELEILSQIIGIIYDAALDPTRWSDALEATARFICGPAAALVSQDAGDHSGRFFFSWGDDPYYTKLHWEKYIKLHPFLLQMMLVPAGGIFSVADVMPLEEFYATRYYKEWAAPQGYCDAISIMLERSGTTLAHLTVPRHIDDGAADDETRRRMALIGPHFRRAITIGKVIKLQKIEAGGLTATLDRLSAAVVLVSATGRIVFANKPAKAMLDDGAVLRDARGILVALDPQAHRSLREIFAVAETGDAAVGVRGIAVPLTGDPHER